MIKRNNKTTDQTTPAGPRIKPGKPRGPHPVVSYDVFERAYRACHRQKKQLSVAAASREFGIPVRTLWRWIADGYPNVPKVLNTKISGDTPRQEARK